MKKLLCVFLSIIASLTLFSCQKKEYSALEYDICHHPEELSPYHSSEIEFQSETRKEFKLFKKKEVTINGEKLVGTYQETLIEEAYNCSREFYGVYDPDSGKMIKAFSINPTTGKLITFIDFLANNIEERPLEGKSREECLSLSLDFLKQYVSDPEAYTLVNEQYVTGSGTYLFDFARFCGGIETNDCARISILDWGKVKGFSFYSLGDMRDFSAPDDEELKKIYSAVDRKIGMIYEELENTYEITYDIRNQEYFKLFDGVVSMIFDVDVKLSPKDDSSSELRDSCRLLVYLD